jgi:hypothetical protein
MSAQSDSPIEHGIGGSLDWLIGGAVSGVVGSLFFGGLLWMIDSDIVTGAIPAIYGLDPGSTIGWTLHLLHGLVLGVVFGFLVTRKPVLGTLTADVETGFLAAAGPALRFAAVGVAYGIAVWTVLPVFAQSILTALSGGGDPGFPVAAFEILVGHLLYGLLLGALFSVFVETAPEAKETDAPFEETSDSSQSSE